MSGFHTSYRALAFEVTDMKFILLREIKRKWWEYIHIAIQFLNGMHKANAQYKKKKDTELHTRQPNSNNVPSPAEQTTSSFDDIPLWTRTRMWLQHTCTSVFQVVCHILYMLWNGCGLL